MIKSVLFDLFGTLLVYDHGRLNHEYPETYSLAQSCGYPASLDQFIQELDQVFNQLEQTSQLSLDEFSMLDVIRAEFALHDISLRDQNCQALADSYCTEWSANILPVPGLNKFLRRLAKQYQLAIVTNTHHKPMVDNLLDRFDISRHMRLVVTSIEHGKAKPHRAIFDYTLDKLNTEADEAIFVGDSYQADYMGASALGIEAYLIGSSARVPVANQIESVIDLPRHRI